MTNAFERVLRKWRPNAGLIHFSDKLSIQTIKAHIQDIDWGKVSQGEGITINDIIENPQLPWRYDYLSWRNDLTIPFLRQYKHKLNWTHISKKKRSITDIIENIDLPWDFNEISSWVLWSDVEDHPELPWNFNDMSSNENITPNVIMANPHCHWNYSKLCQKMPLDFLYENKLDYDSLSNNLNITINYIIEHQDQPWNYGSLACNRSITFEDIQRTPYLPWDIEDLYYDHTDKMIDILPNYCISWRRASHEASLDTIIKHPNKPWNYSELSLNPRVTIEYIRQNKDQCWVWDTLTNKFNVEELISNRDLPWVWKNLFYRQGVNWDLIEQANIEFFI